ncbi:MAG: hypothetical protein Kow0062_10650 [Acidobacteriota bacterium]
MSGGHADVLRLVCQADLLLLASDLLAPPGSWEIRGRDVDPCALSETLGHAGLDGDGVLAEAAGEAIRHWKDADPGQAALEWCRLFEGAQECPPNETAWIRRDKGAILADLAGFYRAFGFEPEPGSGEKPDHARVELQFAALVLLFIARASERDDQDRETLACDALRKFLADHLSCWAGDFARRLAAVSDFALARATGRYLAALLDALGRAWKIDTLPETAALPIRDDGTPWECDGCGETGRTASRRYGFRADPPASRN